MDCQERVHEGCETLACPFMNREEVQRVSKEKDDRNKDSDG